MKLFPLSRHAAHVGRVGLLALACATSLASHAVTDSKAARYYEDALGRYERHDMPGAIIQLKNALQIDKNMLPVQVLLGKALLANGEAATAEVALLEALRLGVNRAEVVVPLAQSFIGQGKHKLVLEQAQFSPTGLPPAVQVQLLLLRASASADLGDVRSALKMIEEARVIDGRSPDVWLAEVPVRIRARQFAEAKTAVERAVSLAPSSAEVQYQKGSLLHVQGDIRAALAAYDAALQLDAKHIEARVARAGIAIDLAKYADAAKDVAEVQRLSPSEPRAAYLKALLAERNGNAAATRTALAEVTGFLDPVPVAFIQYRPQLLMLNGLAHLGLNEREKAKPYLESYQRIQSNSPVSKLLAQIFLSEENFGRAIEVLEEYIKAQPGDGQAMTLLAGAHMAQGRNAKATALMQQALALKDVPEFRATLGMSLVGGGQIGEGVAQLEAAFKDPNQIQAGAALAGLYLRDRQSAKAIAVINKLLKQQPANAGFNNLLGMAQAQSGNLVAAKTAFERALQTDPSLLQAKLNLARLDMASKNYDAAAARLTEVLKADDKNVDATYEMANLADRRGQAAETLRWLEKANDIAGPRELRPGISLVELHLRNRAPTLALDAAKRLYAKAPDNLSALLMYGRAQLANGDVEGAKSTFSGATRFADFNAPQQTEIAALQMAANNVAGAAYSLEKALSSRPEFLPALALMTDVELRQGTPAKAEQRARQVLALAPKRAIGYSLLGDVAQARGQTAAAIDAYRKAHQAEPSSETLLRLFRALSSQDGGKPALQLGEQWVKSRPQDLLVRRALADAYARNGSYAAARVNYESLVQALPDDAEVLNNLANVLLRLKDPSAVAMAERALVKDPSNANAIDTLGWALFRGGQAEQADRALQLLRDARLREPANPSIRYHLAAVLAQSGRKTEARDEVEAALKIGRPFESSAAAETLLKTLR
ncbi:putative PEP-CTERM system TPR-repeat lipoprotein [Rhodoferax ferrireducens]|uniref:PEP-CTERM system TPR-repeat lipoprotein n=1 Tax=Rhodoferax ferrireducens TaxID=192843 RepID=A0ABU2C409_9BURK|nr:XrtA/PEP-CTERM system TPR-repeat protein PrsT [Rhodoferax ferrireducens]MDR7375977.1 putative PEP-CTERM system TPR-repeat lipoprotein [Rhodoferax ferrireducens]